MSPYGRMGSCTCKLERRLDRGCSGLMPPVLHRLTHERPELQDILAEDRAVFDGGARRCDAGPQLDPDAVVGPVIDDGGRVDLEVRRCTLGERVEMGAKPRSEWA
jgi:hypothetical protein